MASFLTLHDAVRDTDFEEVLHKAVMETLTAMGDEAYKIDWANISVRSNTDITEIQEAA